MDWLKSLPAPVKHPTTAYGLIAFIILSAIIKVPSEIHTLIQSHQASTKPPLIDHSKHPALPITLFGDAHSEKASSLKLKLHGIVITGENRAGSALISAPSLIQRAYQTGDSFKLSGKTVKIENVSADKVKIRVNGLPETLWLEKAYPKLGEKR